MHGPTALDAPLSVMAGDDEGDDEGALEGEGDDEGALEDEGDDEGALEGAAVPSGTICAAT